MKDLTGLWFGHLQVIKPFLKKNGNTRWLCKCDCGKECVIFTYKLTSGRTKSCGCKSKAKQKWEKLKNENYRFLKLIEEIQKISEKRDVGCGKFCEINRRDHSCNAECNAYYLKQIQNKINEVIEDV